MKYQFNSVYRITSVSPYTDKETGESKFCVSTIKQSKYPVANLTNFFYTSEEFEEIYGDYIQKDEFNYGLVGFYIKTLKQVEEDVIKLSKEKIE